MMALRTPVTRPVRGVLYGVEFFALGVAMILVARPNDTSLATALIASVVGMMCAAAWVFDVGDVFVRMGLNSSNRVILVQLVYVASLVVMWPIRRHWPGAAIVLGSPAVSAVQPVLNIIVARAMRIVFTRERAAAAAAPTGAGLLRAPGSWLRRALAFTLLPRVLENIVDPVLADVHVEWVEAVSAQRTRLWPYHLRAYWLVLQQLAYAAWRAFRGD